MNSLFVPLLVLTAISGASIDDCTTNFGACSSGTSSLIAAKREVRKSNADWVYKDLAGWNKVPRSMCGHRGEQSPINIIGSCVNYNNNLGPLNVGFKTVMPVTNAHTLEIDVASVQPIVTLDNKDYNLHGFQFHSPSENTIDGKYYAMEAHMVHKTEGGESLVIAQLFDVGSENPFLEKFWLAFPKDVRKGQKRELPDPYTGLLPTDKAYFRWTGSFTTPPCTKGVEWVLMRTAAQMSQQQLDTYREGINTVSGHKLVVKVETPAQITGTWNADLGVNNRPVQDLGDRVVQGFDGVTKRRPEAKCSKQEPALDSTPEPTIGRWIVSWFSWFDFIR